MAQQNDELQGPDLEAGISMDQLQDGRPLLGHAHGESVIVVKTGDQIHAVDATCTHYGGPLAEGLVADGTVRCPLHHARFELATGHARAPAMDDIGCYQVVRDGDRVRVGLRREPIAAPTPTKRPESVVVVGGGAAGAACAETLRDFGYDGPIVVVGDEDPFPVDRPNLSKDYLAGNAPPEWLPVRPESFYPEHDITWKQTTASSIDPEARELELQDGETLSYGALLLATGSEPRRLPIEGMDLPHVHTLRTTVDSGAIAAEAEEGERAVVIGASFIGLEVAAALREHDVEVTVVAPEAVPLQNVMGRELGRAVQVIHEDHGVTFELGHRPSRITDDHVELDDGRTLPADLVVVGVGVLPRTALAEAAGLDVDNGVLVDRQMRTSDDAIYAAGDIARFPRADGGVRVEHWVVAQRQGEVAAGAMLGRDDTYDDVPFFWSRHYDSSITYVGHASSAEHVEISGSLDDLDATIAYRDEQGAIVAVANIGRPGASLQAELAMERGDQDALEGLLE